MIETPVSEVQLALTGESVSRQALKIRGAIFAIIDRLSTRMPCDVAEPDHLMFYGQIRSQSGEVLPDKECFVGFSNMISWEELDLKDRPEELRVMKSKWEGQGNGDTTELFMVTLKYPQPTEDGAAAYICEQLTVYLDPAPSVEIASWAPGSPKVKNVRNNPIALEKAQAILNKACSLGESWGISE